MKNSIETEIIVLSEIRYSESSKILRCFTRESGKVNVMAKGALKHNSKLVTFSQPYCHFLSNLSQGKNLYYIDPIKIIDSNFGLRKNYNSIILAGFISELVDKSFLEGEISQLIFDLIAKTLKLMSKNSNVELLALAFALKYVSFLGYRPKLKIIDEFEIYFSNSEGGITNKSGTRLKSQDVYYLNNLLYTSLDEIEFEYEKTDIIFLINILAEYIKYNLDISEFNSLKIL